MGKEVRRPTEIEAQRIHDILEKVEATEQSITWHGTLPEAIELSNALGYKLQFTNNCHSCRLRLLNVLRQEIGLPGIGRKAPEEWSKARFETCQTCPAYHKRTKSCGRLIIDAISPKTVKIDGEDVTPCGCFLPLKVEWMHSQCPANRWEK